LAILGISAFSFGFVRSSFYTGVGVPHPQPVPFSHQHHVTGLGIDCRYCHTTVEESAFAGMPTTQTCINCHSQLWSGAPLLAPIRESWSRGVPVRWRRVNSVPDFVYFDHSIHIAKGIGCVSCHGRVDQMPLMQKGETLFMGWCLDCHRSPHASVRPREKLFDLAWKRPRGFKSDDQADQTNIQTLGLTDCSSCHR
jgi:hypothetical protein